MTGIQNFITAISFREPMWLLLSLQPVIYYLVSRVRQRRLSSRYAEAALLPWVLQRDSQTFKKTVLSKNSLYLLAWIFLSISLSGPRVIEIQNNKSTLTESTIMLVIDVSRSMNMTDITPNRLRRVQIEISDLVKTNKNSRIGIIVYAARPHLYVPPTSDMHALSYYLDALDELVLPTYGSQHLAAINFARQYLENIQVNKSIILFSDGEHADAQGPGIKDLDKSIPIYVMATGTHEGDAIPLQDGSWLKYDNKTVISRLNDSFLKAISSSTGGRYTEISDDDSDWNTIYQQGILQQEKSHIDTDNPDILWQELYHWSLLPALLLFILALNPFSIRLKNFKFLFFILFIYLSPGINNDVLAQQDKNELSAYKAYSEHDFSLAIKLYKTMPGYRGRFGEGLSLYRHGNYQAAARQFSQAILLASSNSERSDAIYNLANSYFRTGNFSRAMQTYQDVLRYQPQHQYAAKNLAVSTLLNDILIRKQQTQQEIMDSRRQGRGPGSSVQNNGETISESTSVSIDENNKNNIVPLPSMPDIDDKTLNQLLASGLSQIELAEKSTAFTAPGAENTAAIEFNTEQQLAIINDSQKQLWKRVFEIEEGFPASVEKPHAIPGYQPW